MEQDYVEGLIGVALAFGLVAVFVLLFIFAPCHGGISDFSEGQFCKDCGEPRYYVCECGHRLNGTFCTYCGAKNEFMED